MTKSLSPLQLIAIVTTGVILCGLAGISIVTLAAQQGGQRPGYTDTPYLPDQKWRVHDAERPRPKVVTPGTFSTQEQPGRPPSDAIVLFDGKDLSKWHGQGVGDKAGQMVAPAWKVENGYMEVVPGTGGIVTKQSFGDGHYHVEWATPTVIEGEGQGRGNSGIILMGKFEIQVLDSYQNPTYADGQAAAMYGQYPPLVNASFKPGEWQVYDIVFEAPRYQGEQLVSPAYVTVFHNGVVVHHRKPFVGEVQHRKVATYSAGPSEAPLLLQNHRNPVRFRNVWVRPLGSYDSTSD